MTFSFSKTTTISKTHEQTWGETDTFGASVSTTVGFSTEGDFIVASVTASVDVTVGYSYEHSWEHS